MAEADFSLPVPLENYNPQYDTDTNLGVLVGSKGSRVFAPFSGTLDSLSRLGSIFISTTDPVTGRAAVLVMQGVRLGRGKGTVKAGELIGTATKDIVWSFVVRGARGDGGDATIDPAAILEAVERKGLLSAPAAEASPPSSLGPLLAGVALVGLVGVALVIGGKK